jgi:hypothetical protein
MSKLDLAQVLAALSFPVVTEIGLTDAPATEAEMRGHVAALIASGGEPAPTSPARSVEGIGGGFDLLTASQMAQYMLDVLLVASLHIGATETYEALRRWRIRRSLIVPGLGALVAHDVVIRAELQRRLVAQGLEDEQAQYLALVAVQAMSDLTSQHQKPPPSNQAPP